MSQPLAVCEENTCLQVHREGKSVPLEVLTCAKKHGLGCSREKWKFTGEWCSRLEIQLRKQEDDERSCRCCGSGVARHILDASLTVELGEFSFFPSAGAAVFVVFFLRARKSKLQQ